MKIQAASVALVCVGLVILVTAFPLRSSATTPAATCSLRDGGALPDPTCTPGALNPAVTQATIGATICKPGYSTSIRPPEAVTEPEKYKSMKAYGLPATDAKKVEYDHLVSLEIGGAANDAANLWPELHSVIVARHQVGSFTKDTLENRLHTLICNGTVPLAAAQQAIASNWEQAYIVYACTKAPCSLPR